MKREGLFTVKDVLSRKPLFEFKELGNVPFLDAHIIIKSKPVILSDSTSYALILNVQCRTAFIFS